MKQAMKYLIVKDDNPVKIVTAEELKRFVSSPEGYSSDSHRVFQLGAEVTVAVDVTITPAPVYRNTSIPTLDSHRTVERGILRGACGQEIDELGRQ